MLCFPMWVVGALEGGLWGLKSNTLFIGSINGLILFLYPEWFTSDNNNLKSNHPNKPAMLKNDDY